MHPSTHIIIIIHTHTSTHTHTPHVSAANVPVPKAPTKPKEPDIDSETPSVGMEEAEVIVNHATIDVPGGQKVIRAEVHMTSSAVLQETANKLTAKSEEKSQASKEQSSEGAVDSKTIAEKESSQQSNIAVKDVEDEEKVSSSAADEGTESAAKLSQEQKMTQPDCNGSSCSPMTTAETMAQNANATERDERLNALKNAWESQDKEDVAYLKIVL